MTLFKDCILNLGFFTVIPVGRVVDFSEKKLSDALYSLPLTGALIGLCLALLNFLCSLLFPLAVADAITIAGMFFLTGGLHLDGLADTTDGFMGGWDRDKIIVIMKDSRVGAHGAAVLILVLLIKFISLATVIEQEKWSTLILMTVLSRWSVLVLGYKADYPKNREGVGSLFVHNTTDTHLFKATVFTLIASAVLAGHVGLITLGGVLGLTLAIRVVSQKKIGGVSGDIFGASIELNELLVLLVASSTMSAL